MGPRVQFPPRSKFLLSRVESDWRISLLVRTQTLRLTFFLGHLGAGAVVISHASTLSRNPHFRCCTSFSCLSFLMQSHCANGGSQTLQNQEAFKHQRDAVESSTPPRVSPKGFTQNAGLLNTLHGITFRLFV